MQSLCTGHLPRFRIHYSSFKAWCHFLKHLDSSCFYLYPALFAPCLPPCQSQLAHVIRTFLGLPNLCESHWSINQSWLGSAVCGDSAGGHGLPSSAPAGKRRVPAGAPRVIWCQCSPLWCFGSTSGCGRGRERTGVAFLRACLHEV